MTRSCGPHARVACGHCEYPDLYLSQNYKLGLDPKEFLERSLEPYEFDLPALCSQQSHMQPILVKKKYCQDQITDFDQLQAEYFAKRAIQKAQPGKLVRRPTLKEDEIIKIDLKEEEFGLVNPSVQEIKLPTTLPKKRSRKRSFDFEPPTPFMVSPMTTTAFF